ncbi:MAG: TonB-dependent receptor [Vicinamibacterales bacterium]
MVYESNFSVMDGQTNYLYQPDTAADAIRKVDATRGEVYFAATREEHQPNSRTQFDNIFSYSASAKGEHLFKLGVQWARLYYESQYSVRGDHYVEYRDGVPLQVRQFNTPNTSKNVAQVLGFFFQDSWSVNRLTLNLGTRWDRYVGTLPAQSSPDGRFAPGVSIPETEVINQNIGVWRLGAAYDLTGSGRTALKASYSRYALQVGIDRVTSVNPLSTGSRTCPWSDPNGDGIFQTSEVNVAQCSAFSGGVGFRYADGISWPYSDEITAGVETQMPGAVRVGAMFYYRTNRDQVGQRNVAVPTSAYTPFTISVPNGPNGATTATVYNLSPAFTSANDTVRNNDSFLNTDYKGIEFTATKRFSRAWQMQAGLTIGNNRGGINATGGQSGTADLNDPNLTQYTDGIVGNDSTVAFRLSGSYRLPYEISLAGSMVANNGYPYVSTYAVSRNLASQAGVALTRSSQTVFLSERGDERLPNVTMFDIRLSRAFNFGGGRSITPQLDLFNITNSDVVTSYNSAVGSSYLFPQEILAPRIIRVGFSLNF